MEAIKSPYLCKQVKIITQKLQTFASTIREKCPVYLIISSVEKVSVRKIDFGNATIGCRSKNNRLKLLHFRN
jgi:hypothetical protein